MKQNVIFDFDGTLARTTPYHRSAWEAVIKALGIKKDLNALLPFEPNLKERFDSYRRIKIGFLNNHDIKSKISAYFDETQDELLAKKIVDLKESLTITAIFQEDSSNTLRNLGVNLLGCLNTLKSNGARIGVISSTREPIICSFLYKCGILETFDFIIGEESLTNRKGKLFDKPNLYAKKVLKRLNQTMDYYIGDNTTIDKEFAKVCKAKFIYANHESDFMGVLNNLK
ncbi:hypothetical protein COY32_03430 [candidate division WWE3 bacterium CG_4_10_14_0_2_um_filter_41_14]|uniref:HAD family hydrolase n=1 Tax=candidate division WWE3 bacterium CG_4_10_14_0_2_um_filter_41_14 TaxID=1975072 RepID=A0A2M7TJ54_UNCKA|nr:MAG: hypothetical protein COY32_03430 [candidate division WWE3 bacterium CG_4_10_14_0_2_um_filter_41_14]